MQWLYVLQVPHIRWVKWPGSIIVAPFKADQSLQELIRHRLNNSLQLNALLFTVTGLLSVLKTSVSLVDFINFSLRFNESNGVLMIMV